MTKLDLELLRQRIADKLCQIEAWFTKDMKLTFVARHPDNPDCIVIVSSDDMNGLIRDVGSQACAGGEHDWTGQRLGGAPDAAESTEWVAFCRRCGAEKQD